METRYRRTGADGPWGDPRRGHGVAMEGYFWRLTDRRSGRVIIALCGVNGPPAQRWANVALASHPGRWSREAIVDRAGDDPARLRVWAGPGALAGDHERVSVDLAPDARLDLRLTDVRGWPRRRPLGGLGAGQAVPGLSQYWHPHVLTARATGRAVLGGETVELDGAQAYAEKNWGSGGFPERWWWGQAHGFGREDACVAFAGGAVRLGPVRTTAT
ncbi:MAG TPA: tocopherol cyclase family protein, partial [Capillimicrobium sp.]